MIEPLIIQRHGRWEFAAHDWFRVAAVARGWESPEAIVENYTHVPITLEEAKAAMAWTFPLIYAEPKVDVGAGAIGAWCVCGEWQPIDEWMSDGTCPFCGSSFSVTITFTTRQ